MIFGSIAYLNLLPFAHFLKQNLRYTQEKQIIRYRQSVPSKINELFSKRVIDAAFISSVKSRHCDCSDLGIVANGAVYSVLLLENKQIFDSESDTSNVLSQVLNLQGKVIIGDKALRYYLSGKESKDLALEWQKETNLPFVFARLCYNKEKRRIKKLAKNFLKSRRQIPYYYLKREAEKKGISPKELKWYLAHIQYKIGYKEKKSLKLFLKKAKAL